MDCLSFFSFMTDFLRDLSPRYPTFQWASALRQMAPVFATAYLLISIIYFRNLCFICKKKESTSPSHH